jgi:DNA-binding NtrC family response regulator
LEELIEGKTQKEWEVDSQIEKADKKIFQRRVKRSIKRYNMTQTAKILGVHRETLYYWIKKRWIKPRRDYRNYPVFTVLDIENLIKWKNTIK